MKVFEHFVRNRGRLGASGFYVDWSKLIFLEYNANGQFVFLDYNNQFGLLDAVVDYLLEKTSLAATQA